MKNELLPQSKNTKISGLNYQIALEEVPAEETIAGDPRQGTAELGKIAGAEVGIWELRDGTVIDTEIDEVFVVIAGGAKIEFLDDQGDPYEVVNVTSGDVMRLAAGAQTRWSVSDFIRKVYIA
ncbi:MAG TPA: cupin domain-containing protein [Microbacteriaceae bacterium]|nr:cupin domain-containing protein [Microbacteriaceae bacterium]